MKPNHPLDGPLNPSLWFNSLSWEWVSVCSLSGKVVRGRYSFTYIKGLKCVDDEEISSDFFLLEKWILTDAGEYFKRTLKRLFFFFVEIKISFFSVMLILTFDQQWAILTVFSCEERQKGRSCFRLCLNTGQVFRTSKVIACDIIVT